MGITTQSDSFANVSGKMPGCNSDGEGSVATCRITGSAQDKHKVKEVSGSYLITIDELHANSLHMCDESRWMM